MGFEANPQKIVIDFEMAMIKVIRHVFGWPAEIHGCFFHLCQSTWRKIQSLGLTNRYKTDKNVQEFCGMLDALAFLPENDVLEGMTYLRSICPDSLDALVCYFDQTYVTGTHTAVNTTNPVSLAIHTLPPRFNPELWNVNRATLTDGMRTNNLCEAWNNGFMHRVGKAHPTIWALFEALKADNMNDETIIKA